MDKYRILIVDDYEPTRKLIRDALEQTGKYTIAEAENGSTALEIFKKTPYDLVISDVMMPQVSGMDLLPALLEIDPGVSVIMITAHTAPAMTVTALKKGALDFLQKPFDLDELLFKVDLYLRQKCQSPEAPRGGPDAQQLPFISGLKDDLAIQQYIYETVEQAQGDNEEIFTLIVELALKVLSGSSACLLLYDHSNDDMRMEMAKSKNGQPPQVRQTNLWRFLFQEVLSRADGLVVNREDHPEVPHSLVCAPLMIRGRIFGMLVVFKNQDDQIFSRRELNYLCTITKRAALNLENQILYQSLYGNVIDTFQSLITSVDARDHYTRDHSQRVAQLAINIAKKINCSLGELESLKIAATLHDIGKISVPDSILLKTTRLSDEEYSIMKNHSRVGESIIEPIHLLDREKLIVRHHHERWDGRGYPDGLAGEKIPLMARILSLVDSFDAMVNNRPYRQAMPLEFALQEIKKGRGTQFDPELVEVFLSTNMQEMLQRTSSARLH